MRRARTSGGRGRTLKWNPTPGAAAATAAAQLCWWPQFASFNLALARYAPVHISLPVALAADGARVSQVPDYNDHVDEAFTVPGHLGVWLRSSLYLDPPVPRCQPLGRFAPLRSSPRPSYLASSVDALLRRLPPHFFFFSFFCFFIFIFLLLLFGCETSCSRLQDFKHSPESSSWFSTLLTIHFSFNSLFFLFFLFTVNTKWSQWRFQCSMNVFRKVYNIFVPVNFTVFGCQRTLFLISMWKLQSSGKPSWDLFHSLRLFPL